MLLLITLYTSFNLYRKNIIYENWTIDIRNKFEDLYKNIKNVDQREIFEKDDEVGVAFDEIKQIIEDFKQRELN
jgi:23S rRNA G2445 N2-methylase RlmL